MSHATSEEYWFVSVKGGAGNRVIETMQQELRTVAEKVVEFTIPEDLQCGSLEKLMTAADLLQKVDANAEQVVRKIERQFEEVKSNPTNGERRKEKLQVEANNREKKLPSDYIESFEWNRAKYSSAGQVDALIRQVVTVSTKCEADLKDVSALYMEKKGLVSTLERMKAGNLQVASLDEVLTPLIANENKILTESEYLMTAVVVVSKMQDKEFRANVDTFCQVDIKTAEDKVVKGSPVVPGSCVHVATDKEGFSIYLVNLLSKFYQEFKTSAQSNKVLVRDYDYEASMETFSKFKLEEGKDQLTAAQHEADDAVRALFEFCSSNFGVAFEAWVHVKALRLFVESILRYGLPRDFSVGLVKPGKKGDKKTRAKLSQLYSSQDKSGMMGLGEDEHQVGGEETFPYVSFPLVLEHA